MRAMHEMASIRLCSLQCSCDHVLLNYLIPERLPFRLAMLCGRLLSRQLRAAMLCTLQRLCLHCCRWGLLIPAILCISMMLVTQLVRCFRSRALSPYKTTCCACRSRTAQRIHHQRHV